MRDLMCMLVYSISIKQYKTTVKIQYKTMAGQFVNTSLIITIIIILKY